MDKAFVDIIVNYGLIGIVFAFVVSYMIKALKDMQNNNKLLIDRLMTLMEKNITQVNIDMTDLKNDIKNIHDRVCGGVKNEVG